MLAFVLVRQSQCPPLVSSSPEHCVRHYLPFRYRILGRKGLQLRERNIVRVLLVGILLSQIVRQDANLRNGFRDEYINDENLALLR